MRVICLYRPNTDHERSVIEFARELQRRYNHELESISVDTREGAELARVYDIMQYPATIALDSSGVLQYSWTDGQLPLINEVIYYIDQS